MSEYLLAEYRAYRALWSAVILNAFRELKGRTDSGTDMSPEELRNAAFMWINDRVTYARRYNPKAGKSEMMPFKTEDEGGIEWICDHLDLSVEWLRQMSMSREGIQRVLNGHDREKGRHLVKVEEEDEE